MFYNGNNFPPYIEISPASSMKGSINVPASKSTSTRAILTASLSEGISQIYNCAESNNAKAMMINCQKFGAIIERNRRGYNVAGVNIRNVPDELIFNPCNSGVVLRLLMGVAGALKTSSFITYFHQSLGRRSHSEMILALSRLGIDCQGNTDDGLLPIRIKGQTVIKGYTEISSRKSSQFLSGLLYLGSLSDNDLHIKVIDSITAPSMVRTTINNLTAAGVHIEYDKSFTNFYVSGASKIHAGEFIVGSDPASSAALLGICSVVDSDVCLNGFYEEELGNGAVIEYLRHVGVTVDNGHNDTLHITGGNITKGLDFDGSLAPDAVPALAAVAAFAEGTSTFYNIEHLRYKECNRISDFRKELYKIGVKSEETIDSLTIFGNKNGYEGGVIVNGHYDHAIIMALTTIGIKCKNSIMISNPYHVGQTYPLYFDDINTICGQINELKYSGMAPEEI
ncbi:3-phosphoshikimate 1-carboxyvinyltransferase [Sodalis sp. RH21]|uniref:3-phosphoshikimate 1-carboxyvinyltransferase n=1 Tax=unclassified Sodalis (in: enterobacteria) TaxID=2636512 RepID=UPI0039B588B1